MRHTIRTPSSDQYTRLLGLDIETACNVGCTSECDHALDQNRNRITLIAVTDGGELNKVWHGEDAVSEFVLWCNDNPTAGFTAHAGKFDFKNIIHHAGGQQAASLLDRWKYDSSLLAFTHTEKIPDNWLTDYEAKRQELNKARSGMKHREAGKHSLKTLAPYFLGVDAFWEPETGHDDIEYVLKDAKYCLELTHFFLSKVPQRAVDFFSNYQLPWAKHLSLMELRGITIDEEELERQWKNTEQTLQRTARGMQDQWANYFKLWNDLQVRDVNEVYNVRTIMRKKTMSEKQLVNHEKNREKALSKLGPLNLNSTKQLTWLLKDQLQLDITGLDGDETTGEEVLQRLALSNDQVKLLLDYRKAKKLCTTYYPKYKNDFIINSKIHADFNPIGARTGRLSCSNPNLQQCPAELHAVFTGSLGKFLITRDLAAIEPTILAYYSEDKELCRIVLNRGDFHGETAKAAFKLECEATEVKKKYPTLRNIAKTVGLAILYGAGKNRVLTTLKENGLSEYSTHDAAQIVDLIRDKYSGVWHFKKELDAVFSSGQTVYNLMGRPLAIPDPDDVYMKGLNTLIQSSASDLLQEGALRINDNLGLDVLLLVHDEVVTEVPQERVDEFNLTITNLLANIKELNTEYGTIPIRTDGKGDFRWVK